jgi:hypothetical protein
VRAGRAEACEINRFAAGKLVPDVRDPRLREFGAELMEARSAKRLRRQPSRRAESGRGELRVFWSNSSVRVQFANGLGGDG